MINKFKKKLTIHRKTILAVLLSHQVNLQIKMILLKIHEIMTTYKKTHQKCPVTSWKNLSRTL